MSAATFAGKSVPPAGDRTQASCVHYIHTLTR